VADRLYRSRDDRMLAGVAAGVAENLDADPSLIRIAWALLTIFTGGIALVVYIVMAIVVPEAPAGYTGSFPFADGPVPGGPVPGSPVPGGPARPDAAPPAAPVPGEAPQPGAPLPVPPIPAAAPVPSYWTSDREARRAARRERRASGGSGRGGLVFGVVLILIGVFFLVRQFVPWFDWNLWWPIGLIALGGLLLVVAIAPGRSSD
jgi:phage shock protein PspC (stress-responsive transcriptional regulator)